MEAISRHLELFAAGLFEEIMRFPYHSPAAQGGASQQRAQLQSQPQSRAEFLALRRQKRRERLAFVMDHELTGRYCTSKLKKCVCCYVWML